MRPQQRHVRALCDGGGGVRVSRVIQVSSSTQEQQQQQQQQGERAESDARNAWDNRAPPHLRSRLVTGMASSDVPSGCCHVRKLASDGCASAYKKASGASTE